MSRWIQSRLSTLSGYSLGLGTPACLMLNEVSYNKTLSELIFRGIYTYYNLVPDRLGNASDEGGIYQMRKSIGPPQTLMISIWEMVSLIRNKITGGKHIWTFPDIPLSDRPSGSRTAM